MLGLLKVFFSEFKKSLVEIIFPEFCVSCGRLGSLLCHRCYEKIEFIQFNINKQEKCPNLDSIKCCSYYSEVSQKIISEFKYKSVIGMSQNIAHLIYYHCNLPEFDLITFVPMHHKKIGHRGFNQTQVIAEELAKIKNIPMAELLIKTKNSKSQMSLGQKINRQENIIGTIEINQKVPKDIIEKYKNVLIIDDVFTSGTTLNYCAEILKDFGFENIHGVCFAHKN